MWRCSTARQVERLSRPGLAGAGGTEQRAHRSASIVTRPPARRRPSITFCSSRTLPGIVVLEQQRQTLRDSCGRARSLRSRRTGRGSGAPGAVCPRGARAAAAAPVRPLSDGSRDPRGSAPRPPALSRSRWVAATTRTSTCTGASPPHPHDLALLQRAQQLDLQRGGMSPSSSRKSVPPSASSNLPRRAATPVATPPSIPNSSLSSSDSGSAAQLSATSGPERPERWCRSLAMSSLPVPLSPRMRTLTPRGATRSARSSTRRIAGAWATMRSAADLPRQRPRSALFSSSSRSRSVVEHLHLARRRWRRRRAGRPSRGNAGPPV
jgi:hypothetical protein